MKLLAARGYLRCPDKLIITPSGLWLTTTKKGAVLVVPLAGKGRFYPEEFRQLPRMGRESDQTVIRWRKL